MKKKNVDKKQGKRGSGQPEPKLESRRLSGGGMVHKRENYVEEGVSRGERGDVPGLQRTTGNGKGFVNSKRPDWDSFEKTEGGERNKGCRGGPLVG